VRLLYYFLYYGNNASIKEKALSMELPKTYVLSGCYKILTPSVMLSNFPLPIDILSYEKKYNNIEWTFSPPSGPVCVSNEG
jgi:hypothetical protein